MNNDGNLPTTANGAGGASRPADTGHAHGVVDGDRPGSWRVLGSAAAAGLLFGPADFAAQKLLPYPFADLGNSMAVWALGAFLFGAWVGAGRLRPIAGAAVLNLVAVESYYLAATLVQHDTIANLWTRSTLFFLFAAVVAGVVFGLGGALARGGRGWQRLVGAALPAAVFLAEAGIRFTQSHEAADAAYRRDRYEDALMYAIIALVLALVTGRGARGRIQGLAVSVALAIPGFVALNVFVAGSG